MITKLKIAVAKSIETMVTIMSRSISKLSASGDTERSIRSEVRDSDEGGVQSQIFARGFTSLLEKGRGPTSKKPSPEMIENLTEYAKARGMENPEKAAWAIAIQINRDGDKTYQKGGRDVYTEAMDKEIDKLIQEVGKVQSDFVVDEIKKAFKTK